MVAATDVASLRLVGNANEDPLDKRICRDSGEGERFPNFSNIGKFIYSQKDPRDCGWSGGNLLWRRLILVFIEFVKDSFACFPCPPIERYRAGRSLVCIIECHDYLHLIKILFALLYIFG